MPSNPKILPKAKKPTQNINKNTKQNQSVKSKPVIVSFISVSSYASSFNGTKKNKPSTMQETIQISQNSTGKINSFYEKKKDGKTIKKEKL